MEDACDDFCALPDCEVEKADTLLNVGIIFSDIDRARVRQCFNRAHAIALDFTDVELLNDIRQAITEFEEFD